MLYVFLFIVIDAAGKLPANVLGGALIWPGGYEECLAVNGATVVNQTNFNVEGKYCLTSIRIPNMPVNALTQQVNYYFVLTNLRVHLNGILSVDDRSIASTVYMYSIY